MGKKVCSVPHLVIYQINTLEKVDDAKNLGNNEEDEKLELKLVYNLKTRTSIVPLQQSS